MQTIQQPLLIDLSGLSAPDVVSKCIHVALAERASDIHFDPTGRELCVSLRIDGHIVPAGAISLELHAECITRLKILSGLRTDEHFLPQDGTFRLDESSASRANIRASIMPTIYGENAVLRLLPTTLEPQSLGQLGFDTTQTSIITESLLGNGILLVTGPTGSGKTSTLYALMHLLQSQKISIVTLEDPVEYALGGISQIQIQPERDFTFGRGLRSVLRQDPDVIMVGEIRDTETAQLAIHAALTGHLVLSTLHTSSAVSTVSRLTDLGIAPSSISSTLRLVISQRLVRKACVRCSKHEHSVDSSRGVAMTATHTVGCERCKSTGYLGRTALSELLQVTPDFAEAIKRGTGARELASAARAAGMRSMMEQGRDKADAGITTIEEVLRIRYA